MHAELGSVLVVGGCGFLGNHLISRLLEENDALQVSVLDLNTTHERLPRVSYYEGDITSKSTVTSVLQQVQPQTIFHTASPNVLSEHANLAERRKLYEKVNIEGTRIFIQCVSEIQVVKAFVYTSSASVVHDSVNDLFDADETLPVLYTPQQAEIYSHTKGVAEQIVLSSNRKNGVMLTTAIRSTSMFGENDIGWLPNLLSVYKEGRSNVQLGDNTAQVDLVYVSNCADAHISPQKP